MQTHCYEGCTLLFGLLVMLYRTMPKFCIAILGLNSMQGRGAKHVRLSQYSRHATLTGRWKLVLRHDYITCVWIRREDPFHSSYVKSYKEQYIPSKISSDGFCYCGFPKEERGQCCIFCSSSLYRAVQHQEY